MPEPLSSGVVGAVAVTVGTAFLSGAADEYGRRVAAYSVDELPKVVEEGWKRHDEATGALVDEFNKSTKFYNA